MIFVRYCINEKAKLLNYTFEIYQEGKLYVLTDRSFRGHVSRGDHFIMMYAPWCGHCNRLKPDWEKVNNDYTTFDRET